MCEGVVEVADVKRIPNFHFYRCGHFSLEYALKICFDEEGMVPDFSRICDMADSLLCIFVKKLGVKFMGVMWLTFWIRSCASSEIFMLVGNLTSFLIIIESMSF